VNSSACDNSHFSGRCSVPNSDAEHAVLLRLRFPSQIESQCYSLLILSLSLSLSLSLCIYFFVCVCVSLSLTISMHIFLCKRAGALPEPRNPAQKRVIALEQPILLLSTVAQLGADHRVAASDLIVCYSVNKYARVRPHGT
jgi:hypothetical protein